MPIRDVLLVDDDDDILDITAYRLGQRGLKVTVARSGEEALERLARQKPDIVLLDILLPGMNGLDLCRRLKADPTTNGVPVLFLTCRGQEDDILQMHLANADGYFIKPFDSVHLAAEVANWHTRAPSPSGEPVYRTYGDVTPAWPYRSPHEYR